MRCDVQSMYKEVIEGISAIIDEIDHRSIFEAINKTKKLLIKIDNRVIGLHDISRAVGGYFAGREMISNLLVRINDTYFGLKEMMKFLKILNNQDKVQYVVDSLSDEISKKIYCDYLKLRMITIFTGINYIFSIELNQKLLDKFDLVGLKNKIVWDNYYKFRAKLKAQEYVHDKDFLILYFKNMEIVLSKKYSVSPFIQDFLVNQYYHSSVKVEKDDIVLDLGGADGTTSLRFALSGAKKVYMFEFDKEMVSLAEKLFLYNGLVDKVEIVPYGVSDRDSELDVAGSFQAGDNIVIENQGVSIANQNLKKIKVVTIDSFTTEKNLKKVDFIKMDIEGSELSAIAGGEETIKKFYPKMAISVYHKYCDPYNIIRILKNLGYSQFYISHRSPGVGEVILFAI